MIEFDDDLLASDDKLRYLFSVAKDCEEKKAIVNEFVRVLHQFLKESDLSDTLFITDPYLLNALVEPEYLSLLEAVFHPLYRKVRMIILIIGKKYNDHLLTFFKEDLAEHGIQCKLRVFQCNLYHDRIWISSGSQQGVYVGTSLNGIGSKYTFVNHLPKKDAKKALEILQQVISSPHATELKV
jgi:hypothetical protein